MMTKWSWQGFVQCKYLVSMIRGEKCKARYGKVQLGLGDCEGGWEKKKDQMNK